MSVSGRTLRSQSQQFVLNLLDYFEREKENNGPCVQERIANALGISPTTVKRIKARKKHVIIKTLNAEVRENHVLLCNSSLNRTVHEMGFKFKKESNRRALVEKNSIAKLRLKFLKGYMNNLNSPSPLQVVFMDKTWIYSKGNPGKSMTYEV
ncbi:hypothetical protein FQR65_LT06892 [Abscondita terminalis]|nr:hypothetical protein FQR65_LT06892 [Abscondita terminalis]